MLRCYPKGDPIVRHPDRNLGLVASRTARLAGGSFLNVVIHRLPLMLEQRWRRECAEFSDQQLAPEETLGLAQLRARAARPAARRYAGTRTFRC